MRPLVAVQVFDVSGLISAAVALVDLTLDLHNRRYSGGRGGDGGGGDG